MTPPILEPGRNCWRIERADRLAFLVDGVAYFSAVRNALLQARHAVYILGWDIDSRLRLARNGEKDGYPERLGEFLNELVHRRRDLHVHVLVWDFAMIYALDRPWQPIYKLAWQGHHRLHFHMDGHHPAGASQHQKIVVIDDTAAFLGGMDLSKARWDTPEHRPLDPRRSGPERLYPPHHDVMALVTGPAAGALGELARERWWRATGERLLRPSSSGAVWPRGLAPDIQSVDLGIARTFPRYNSWDPVREVERLYTDAIRAAKRYIYFENQYFTSNHVCNLLAGRLAEEHGPEVVMVLPKRSDGWLEQHTMDVLRARVLGNLRAADRDHRFAVFYPDHPEVQPDYINVHDKVMVVDDELLRIGSANLSNRSMGLDSECDLALEARGDALTRAQIASFRNRLLAEHLETTPEAVAEALARTGSLLRTVADLQRPGRTLMPLDPHLAPDAEDRVHDVALVDPEQPIEAEMLVRHFIDEEERAPARRHLTRNIIVLSLLLLLAGAWRFTPLRDYLQVDTLMASIQMLHDLPAAPLLTLGGFVVGGLVSFPVTVLVVITVLAFGPVSGYFYALIGSMLSAFATYGVGNWLGRDLVRRFAGARINRLSRRLAERGVLAVAVIRFVPVAPFSVVNMVAGASHIRFRDFALGTLLGMAPGMLAMAVFVDRIAASLASPEPVNFVMLAGVALLIVLAALALRRLLRRRAPQGDGADDTSAQ